MFKSKVVLGIIIFSQHVVIAGDVELSFNYKSYHGELATGVFSGKFSEQQPLKILELSNLRGNISIHVTDVNQLDPSDQHSVILNVTKIATTKNYADMTVHVQSKDGQLQISSKAPKGNNAFTHFTIEVPSGIALKLKTGHGNMVVNNLMDALSAQSDKGSIAVSCQRLSAQQHIALKNKDGNIVLQYPHDCVLSLQKSTACKEFQNRVEAKVQPDAQLPTIIMSANGVMLIEQAMR